MSFGEVLRGHRLRIGLTQEQLAERSGLSTHSINVLERGRRRPRLSSVTCLVSALELDPADREEFIASARPAEAVEAAVVEGSGGESGPAPQRTGRELPADRPEGGAAAYLLPAQLPSGVREFIGRQEALGQLGALLSRSAGQGGAGAPAVAVVSGPPGVGKSALAVQAARKAAADYPDGTLFADLRGGVPSIADPSDVLVGFLRALGVQGRAIPADPVQQQALYRSVLDRRRVLVVLDNAVDSAQVRPLVPGAPGCAVIVTSRGRLAGLPGARVVELDVLGQAEAVELFRQISGRGADDATDRIVTSCGHLPLAVRIAASRLAARPAWTTADLADRLADQHRRLDELSVDDLDVRASIALSLDTLPRPTAAALGLLAFLDTPTVTLPLAAALLDCSPDRAEAVLERLFDAHLLLSHSPGQYGFHDLVRAFAHEHARTTETPARLVAAAERAVVAATMELARLIPHPRPGTELARAALALERPAFTGRSCDWVEAELGNLLAVVDLVARTEGVPARAAAELVEILQRPLVLTGRWGELEHSGRAALAAAERDGDTVALALAQRVLGRVAVNRDDLTGGAALLGASLEHARRAGDLASAACTLMVLGTMHGRAGEHEQAVTRLQEALATGADEHMPSITALTHNYLGEQYLHLRQTEPAHTHLTAGLFIARRFGDQDLVSMSLQLMGAAYQQLGDTNLALRHHLEGAEIAHARGSLHSEAIALTHLSSTLLSSGQTDAAADQLEQAAKLFETHGDDHRAAALRGQAAAHRSTA